MKTSTGLLLATVFGMVLAGPPAYPQKVDEKTLLNNLSVDMINLKNTLKQMQDASDKRNADTTKLLQDMARRRRSASPSEYPPMMLAICITCSW